MGPTTDELRARTTHTGRRRAVAIAAIVIIVAAAAVFAAVGPGDSIAHSRLRQSLKVPGLLVQVDAVHVVERLSLAGETVRPEGKFVVIDMVVTNRNSEQEVVSNDLFRLVDGSGHSYKVAGVTNAAQGGTAWGIEVAAAGRRMAKLVFDVAPAAVPLSLEVSALSDDPNAQPQTDKFVAAGRVELR